MQRSRRWWPVAGAVVGLLGLAFSYLGASLLRIRASPPVAVADWITALTPGSLAEWAIQNFGTNDKKLLIVGMLVVLALVFARLGAAARRRWWVAALGFTVIGAVGLAAVLREHGSGVVDVLPVAVGAATWALGFSVAALWLRRWEVVEADTAPGEPEPSHTRRAFFVGISGMTAAVALAGVLGRVAGGARRKVEESRRLLRLEGVTQPQVPDGARLDVEGISAWMTPADDFYLIDTAYIKPAIEPQQWRLRIHGMVENEITLTYDQLVSRKLTEDWMTLNCVSNEVGGDLIGNAWWSGVKLSGLLAQAKPHPGADAVLQTSDDGWTCGTPLAALTDHRNALLAVAMNGEALPIEHGFPVRTIVPGLYGYVSACKWVVDLEVTTFDRISGYWISKGWSEMGPVKIASRIDVPTDGAKVPAGSVALGGVAWHQETGISAVEVSVDGGAWTRATLGSVPSVDTWVQWRLATDLSPGKHELRVRAVDRGGEVQTGVVTAVAPNGATGWHTIEVTAK
ncbi:MAG TPA: molybdopterin-dependent oxidoreductase [Nocardioides sp.]|nr:molybdopterin-dependent oxidoreductase [Nocardioides sp.]